MSDVHLVSVEQASYLQAALWTRGEDEPFPPCPICGERPLGIVSWRDGLLRDVVRFDDCGDMITVAWWDSSDWYATETPWTRMFEEMSHQRQVEARRERQ